MVRNPVRLLFVLVVACFGCSAQAADPVSPMPLKSYGDPGNSQRIYVLLPGIRDRAKDFADEEFIQIAQPLIARGDAVIAADAHYGYYESRTVVTRLDEDLLQRYPDADLQLVGISLGGFGALLLAERHPKAIDEILLLSPFLGPDEYLPRVRAGDFRPREEGLEQGLARVWAFLLDQGRGVRITLAYGNDDDFVPFYNELRQKAPDIRQIVIQGDHDWDTWRALWRRYVGEQVADGASPSAE